MNKYNWIFVALFFLPSLVSANQWVYGKVQRLEEYGAYGGSAYQVLITLIDIQWVGAGAGAANCGGRFSVQTGQQGVTSEIKNRIFSMMLTANTTNGKVGLFVDENSGPNCLVQVGRIGSGF